LYVFHMVLVDRSLRPSDGPQPGHSRFRRTLQSNKKPVVALIAGRYSPPERRMGHAGALTLHAQEDVESKIAALQDAGVMIASSAHLVGAAMREAASKRAA
jgi:succinyl-CoA synthetase alpha subunit